jgi:hypothetical protein
MPSRWQSWCWQNLNKFGVRSYWSVHNCVDAGDQIPPSLPLQKGVPRFAGFVKEGLGEIFERICLLYYGLLG